VLVVLCSVASSYASPRHYCTALPVALEEYFPHNKKGGKDRNNSGESDSDSEDSEDSEFDLDPDVELMEVKVLC
jgi:hypothetical protein